MKTIYFTVYWDFSLLHGRTKNIDHRIMLLSILPSKLSTRKRSYVRNMVNLRPVIFLSFFVLIIFKLSYFLSFVFTTNTVLLFESILFSIVFNIKYVRLVSVYNGLSWHFLVLFIYFFYFLHNNFILRVFRIGIYYYYFCIQKHTHIYLTFVIRNHIIIIIVYYDVLAPGHRSLI